MDNRKQHIKLILAVVSFVAAIAFGTLGIFLPPQGIISGSVLIWLAQLLVFCSMMLGFSTQDNQLYKELVELIKELKQPE